MIFELSAVVFALIVLVWLIGLEYMIKNQQEQIGQLRNKVKKLEAITSYPTETKLSKCQRCNGHGHICTDVNQMHMKKCEVCLGAGTIFRQVDN